jgi:histone deacetylase 1/2
MKRWKIKHLDVKIAFLHGDIQEEVFMLQPKGFTQLIKKQKVCLLLKALYRLEQTSRLGTPKLTISFPLLV